METKLYFMRHELIEGKYLTNDGIARARATGVALKKRGLTFDWATTSPQWRCIQTVYNVVQSGEFDIPLGRVDSRLDDLSSDAEIPIETKAFIADCCQQNNNTKKTDVLLGDESLRPHILRRGAEGAEALIDSVRNQPGKNILVCSHGGSRMEPAISILIGQDVSEPPFLFNRGEIAVLHFENLLFQSFEYLGHIT